MRPIDPNRLPDLLTAEDGRKITSKEEWEAIRRPEIVRFFQEEVFGVCPPKPEKMTFTCVSHDETALEGTAILDTIEIAFEAPKGRYAFQLHMFLPKMENGKPCPAALLICNRDPEENMDLTRKRRTGFWPVEAIVKRGWAACAFFNGQLDTDADDGFQNGVHRFYKDAQEEHDWATIAAWAWGAMRCMDYLTTDPRIDASRITVTGQSRGGKTAMYTGLCDRRFAAYFSSCSGCVGAALSRFKGGETIRQINEVFPFWFCEAFKKYNDREFDMPMDQHGLLACIAPKLLYVTSATEDEWADPDAEYASAQLAGDVYRLYGMQGLPRDAVVEPDRPVWGEGVGYHRRTGIHDLTEFDWMLFLDFVEKSLG